MILQLRKFFEGYFPTELLSKQEGYREVYRAITLTGHDVVIIVYDMGKLPSYYSGRSGVPEFEYSTRLKSPVFPKCLQKGIKIGNGTTLYWMVKEYVFGTPLLEWMSIHQKMPQKKALSVMRDIVYGIKEVFWTVGDGCINSINPNNIIIHTLPDGELRGYIVNLEHISRIIIKKVVFNVEKLSPLFRAPETFIRKFNIKSDIYSCTLLLAYMVLGFHPWKFAVGENEELSEKEVFQKMMSKPPVLKGAGKLRELFKRGLCKNPYIRFSGIEEFGAKIFDLLNDSNLSKCFVKDDKDEQAADSAVTDVEAVLNDDGTWWQELEKLKAEMENDMGMEGEFPEAEEIGAGNDIDEIMSEEEDDDIEVEEEDEDEEEDDDEDDEDDETDYGGRYDGVRDRWHRMRESGANDDIRIERVKGGGFKDVAGMEPLKCRLRRDFIDIIKNRKLAAEFNVTPPNGILLWGPPGTGKTFISRKLAEECGLMFGLVKPSDLGSIYIHGSQGMISNLFRRCESLAAKNKCGVLLVFDEFDSLVPIRNENADNHQANEVAEFLTQLNDCALRNVYVVATTNRIEAIDPAILRKGRIDEVVYVGLPDKSARRELLELELASRPHANIDMDKIVELTEGYTSSDISFVIKESARVSFEQSVKNGKIVKIDEDLLVQIISETSPSVGVAEYIKYEKSKEKWERRNKRSSRPRIGFKPGV